MSDSKIQTLFVDVGGVLLTNGWDQPARERASKKFGFDYSEFAKRHLAFFECYENGKITLNDYLEATLFYKPQDFTLAQFKEFILEQSQPYPQMLNLMKMIKKETHIKIFIISNEGREIMDHRIKAFNLYDFAEAFIVSSFVGIRKPAPDIYRLALDIAYCKPSHVIYIDDRKYSVEIAQKMGMVGIHHTSYEQTLALIQEAIKHPNLG